MKYLYYATFTPDDGMISVDFPDIEGCYTYGADIAEAIENAQDVLAVTLARMESEGKTMPQATAMQVCDTVLPIVADTLTYKKMYEKKSVKKTLSIPQWLNEEAEKKQINFSRVLQDGLMRTLGYT